MTLFFVLETDIIYFANVNEIRFLISSFFSILIPTERSSGCGAFEKTAIRPSGVRILMSVVIDYLIKIRLKLLSVCEVLKHFNDIEQKP